MKDIDPKIAAFAEIAKRYCEWAEKIIGDPEMEIRTAERLLAELHLNVIKLSYVGDGEGTEYEISSEEWSIVRERFEHLPINIYWDVCNPLKEEPPVLNLLSDDLADIYNDVKVGLVLYRRGHVADAVWEWRFNFKIHWGAHLTSAQRAIRSYLSGINLNEE